MLLLAIHYARTHALLMRSCGTCAHVTDIPRAAAEDVPRQVGQVSFVLERGSKVQYTDAATVDTERKAYWHQVLKLTATMAKDSNKILPKEYVLKVQSVKSSDIRGKRNTFGKAVVNLTEYCTLEPTAGRDVSVQLKPYGTVRLNIKATWIQNASPQQDALTELSYMSSLGQQSMNSSGLGSDAVDQDLEGFDDDGRQRTPISEPASRQQSPFKQRRTSGALGLGPLGSGPPAQSSDTNGTAAVALGPRSSAASRHETCLYIRQVTNAKYNQQRNGNRHKRSQSTPLNLPVDIPEASSGDEEAVGSPGARAREHDSLIQESFATLLSSDDDDEKKGIVASAKRWWGTGGGAAAAVKQPPRPDPNESPFGRPDPALQSATNLIQSSDQDYEAVMKETDVQALQQRCRQLLRQRDADRLARRQELHRQERLQAQIESLGRAKGMMAERLAVSEGKLMKLHHDEVIKNLVAAKMELAQSQFETLEIQGQLKEEQAKSQNLLSRLSAMETDYHAALNAAQYDDDDLT
ncbi:MAG: hypothetical protein FRX49_13710 [Trebouxia sp. A1-2]|nr:MAG: hypothetical protein FRX49_13710 [Trebouxia sp. A1-2]